EALEGVVGCLAPSVARSGSSLASIATQHHDGAVWSNVVHDGLPLFQWTGFVCDEQKEVFQDVDNCLRRFEDVLSSHSLDMDVNWSRLLPRYLSNNLNDWLNKFVRASGSGSYIT
ncbi:hypothetical protein, partial, partial [Parasitella parasitica]